MTKINLKNRKLVLSASLSLVLAVASLILINFKSDKAIASKTAEQLGREIRELQSQIDSAEKRASDLRNRASSLENELAGIDREKKLIESQIQISQREYEKLQLEIKETEQEIKDNRRALGVILVKISLENDISPIERIAGSQNISEALDSIEYQNSIKNSLIDKVEEIKLAKERLEKKRDEVKVALINQQKSEQALKAKIDEQNKLIAQTRGEEAEYAKFAKERGERKLKLQQEQQAAIQAAINRASGGAAIQTLAGSTSYPWNSSNCFVDANAWSHGGADGRGTDGLGYGCRQCVSYTAWRLLREKGIRAINWGNANMWPANARAAGFRTSSTPKAGSLGVISAGQYGHIVWVEAVEGNYVIISQYNYFNAGGPGWGHYSKMRVPASTYDTYIHF